MSNKTAASLLGATVMGLALAFTGAGTGAAEAQQKRPTVRELCQPEKNANGAYNLTRCCERLFRALPEKQVFIFKTKDKRNYPAWCQPERGGGGQGGSPGGSKGGSPGGSHGGDSTGPGSAGGGGSPGGNSGGNTGGNSGGGSPGGNDSTGGGNTGGQSGGPGNDGGGRGGDRGGGPGF